MPEFHVTPANANVDAEHHARMKEVERLEAKIKIAQLEGILATTKATTPKPIWARPVLLGFLGTLAAAIAPIVVAINGFYGTKQQVELSRIRLSHEISASNSEAYAVRKFLEQALDPKLSEPHRFRALRFLRRVPDSASIREWAAEELNVAEGAIATHLELIVLDAEIAQLERKILDAQTGNNQPYFAWQLEVTDLERQLREAQQKRQKLETQSWQESHLPESNDTRWDRG